MQNIMYFEYHIIYVCTYILNQHFMQHIKQIYTQNFNGIEFAYIFLKMT